MNNFLIIGLVILFKSLYLLTPLAIIWGINHLAGLDIAYSFLNWLAVFVVTIGVKVLLSTRVEVTKS